MSMESISHTFMSGDPMNTNMQPAHGTLRHDGQSLDGREYQRGDPVAIVDDGARESLADAIQILNLRNNEYMLVLLKAVCWVPTHTEQRSGTTFLLTLYGPNLDFSHSNSERPQMGYRGIATLFGSCVYVGREVMLEGNLSRVNLDPANRVSLFTAQWDAISVHSELQQPALTPSASSCASSRSPSESGDDAPPPRFYRLQGRRDSAIEIRDPESPIYKSSNGRKSISPKPLFTHTASFATKYNIPIAAETPSPKRGYYETNTPAWSDLGSDDDFSFDADAAFNFDPAFPDSLDLCINEPHFGNLMADSDLQVNFVFMPQNEGDNFASGHPEQQRSEGNAQEPLWSTHGIPAGHENAWDSLQVPPQHASEMRQQQPPTPQRQQQLPTRQGPHADYYEPYRLAENQASSHIHPGAAAHHPTQTEVAHMPNDPRAGYAPSQLPPATAQPMQGFQMQSRYPEQSSRVPASGPPTSSFPTLQEVHIIQSNRQDPRQPHSLASSSYSPVHEGALPSSSHSQQLRRSPLPEESRAPSSRGTPVMARRAPAQPVHTFSPAGLVDSFRQSTQAHISTLESHYEQLQQNPTGDDQLRQASEALQAVRQTTDDSLQLLNLLQPITGIPLKGTEKRLQSLADQIVEAMKELLPNASDASEQSVQKMGLKVQNLKDFIEYVEGVHPEVVKRLQDPAAAIATSDKSKNVSSTAAGLVPSAPPSVSSQAADESDSCRWVDGQATPPPDRSSAMAQNRDRSRMFRDMTNAHGRRTEPRINSGADFYPPTSYSQPASRIHSPMASHAAPAEPQHPTGHGFFQQSLPTPLQQTMQMPDFGASMHSRPMQAYPPPSSVEMMRPMQPIPSMPPQQHYTTQQETSFYLRPNPPNSLYPASGAEISQAAYAPRSPLSFQSGSTAAHPEYYQDVRSTLPDRRTVRQERPAPYSLNYRDQRRRRGSQ
ncbi:uncharacterized protein ColSpa_10885 [Colletotrichum spaethianum]|uniref:Uncharacterized protein n=1 Tax=Colletotrichum spaethianum TaxID=700344 RepID=A0AA37PEF9_9PEZI|nr:uncharacterized protein ColSpa_10885 [Colletotrichum spaethianum]GKT50704.1 hypothetical protein ColSpa_10885 [Colletotrichum spaethianum]